jgi:hypothetical protein
LPLLLPLTWNFELSLLLPLPLTWNFELSLNESRQKQLSCLLPTRGGALTPPLFLRPCAAPLSPPCSGIAGTATLEPKQRMSNIEHSTSNVQVNGEATKGRTAKKQRGGSGDPPRLRILE